MSLINQRMDVADAALVQNARSGDQRAFAELWRRHYRSGIRVARQFSSVDADDLVAEAYTRIYQLVLSGGGPVVAFRPYLYTTIRNLASTWGAASRDVQVDELSDFEDPATVEDPAALALDRTLTARAFRALPERWQSVLWYTEVEGMDPHEVAPLLGLTANGVAALSYRAREGLRKAWLQAHISDDRFPESCKWSIARMGDHARNSLSEKESERLHHHLATCARCSIVSEEVDEVGSHLATVMLPILLGGTAGGALLTLLSQSGPGGAASASAVGIPAAAIPAVPASFGVLGAASAPVAVTGLSLGAASGATALLGSLAVAATLSVGVVLGVTSAHHDASGEVSAAAHHFSSASRDSSTPSRSGVPLRGDTVEPTTRSDVTAPRDPVLPAGVVRGGVGDHPVLGPVPEAVPGGTPCAAPGVGMAPVNTGPGQGTVGVPPADGPRGTKKPRGTTGTGATATDKHTVGKTAGKSTAGKNRACTGHDPASHSGSAGAGNAVSSAARGAAGRANGAVHDVLPIRGAGGAVKDPTSGVPHARPAPPTPATPG